ncbi:DNA alkylation repair protein [Pediococcus ethanolidurans]
MRNQFLFLRLKTPESKPLIQVSKSLVIATIRQWISEFCVCNYREYQYLAIELADKNLKKFSFEDIIFLKQFLV